MKNLIILSLSLLSISAFAETAEKQFAIECSETVMPSGQSITMNANYTLRDPLNDFTVSLFVPLTRYKTDLLFHIDLNQNGESRITMKLNEENVTDDLAAVSSTLHLDGRDALEVAYPTSKPDITGVKAKCIVKPRA